MLEKIKQVWERIKKRIRLKKKIKQTCINISEQDNRWTQRPIYKVMSKKDIWANPNDSDSYKVRVWDDWLIGKDWEIDWNEYFEENIPDDELEDRLEEENDSRESPLHYTYIKDVWEVWNCAVFFTEKAAHQFIEANRHNLCEPHVYVDHAYRNPELKMIVDFMFETAWMELPSFWR